MPCILCKRDVPFTERLLLEDCSPKDRQFYEANYFTNWEFNYLCRRCYWRDFFRRAQGNLVGVLLTLFMRFSMVFAASLVAWSVLSKYGARGKVLAYGPVVFSALATLVFFRYFVKILTTVVLVVFLGIVLIYGAAYSDTMSLLPDLGAVVERERMKQGTLPDKGATTSRPGGKSTTGTAAADGRKRTGAGAVSAYDARGKPVKRRSTYDPLKAAEERRARARQARINAALDFLERYSPFYFRLSLEDIRKNVRPSLQGFALLYAILLPWHFLVVPLYRLLRERSRPD